MNKQNLLSTHNLFTLRLLLSVLGAYIGYTYRHTSHDYWFAMMFLFTAIAIAPGYYRFKQHGDNLKALIERLLHWSGGLCAGIVIYAYHNSGRIFHEEAGLIVLLILALTTYLDGIKRGWRCIFAGLFLGLITVCVAYFDSYIWQLMVLAAVAVIYSHYHPSDDDAQADTGLL
ncbi:MAG: hypothetical protein ACXW03_07505 [Methylobacter sp.]|jgi:hypothetical protein